MQTYLEENFVSFQEYLKKLLDQSESKDWAQQRVLMVHAMNLSFKMKCTGLMEDDEEISKGCILPNNWNQHLDNVYSFRYSSSTNANNNNNNNNSTINEKNTQGEKEQQLFFKLIMSGDLLDINCVQSTNADQLHQYEFKLDPSISQSKLIQIVKESSFQSLFNLYKDYYHKFIAKIIPNAKAPTIVPLAPNSDIFKNRNDNNNSNSFLWQDRNRFEQPQQNPINGMIIGGPQDLHPFNNNPLHNLQQPGIRYDPVGPMFGGPRPNRGTNNPFPFGNNDHNHFGHNPNNFF